jgi:Tfp pilus assembly protein PilX
MHLTKMNNQHGNALVIILVMIALLAALTAVSMRSSNRSSENSETEGTRIQVEKLMRTAKNYENGVAKLMSMNKCSENDINFVNTITTRNRSHCIGQRPVFKDRLRTMGVLCIPLRSGYWFG